MKTKTVKELVDLVETSYNNIAHHFDLTRKKRSWPKVEELCLQVKNNSSVLDLACGNGRLLEFLGDKKVNYLGIDISKELIKIASNNYSEFDFKVGDVLNLNEILQDNQRFDYIFFLAALQHVPSKKQRLKALRDIKDHLSDTGVLIISNWNLWQTKHRRLIFSFALLKALGINKLEFGDIIFPWKDVKGNDREKRYYHAFTKRELISLAKLAGFSDIKIQKDKYNYWLILKK